MWISTRGLTFGSPKRIRGAVVLLGVLACCTGAGAAEFVAGTTPDRRPEGAPRIQSVQHDAQWRVQALRGVSKPIPKSLTFVDDQGAWFTPFTRPNMPPPYDIRGFYAAPGGNAEK